MGLDGYLKCNTVNYHNLIYLFDPHFADVVANMIYTGNSYSSTMRTLTKKTNSYWDMGK